MGNPSTAYVDAQVSAARRCFENLQIAPAETERALANLRVKLELYVAENAR